MIARKLLIAEDEPDLAEALQIFFEKNQFTVDTVFNGADAYAYAQSGGYDALILDVMMPKLNGLAVVRLQRAQAHRGDTTAVCPTPGMIRFTVTLRSI